MKIKKVKFRNIECNLEFITKGCYRYEGYNKYELWANIRTTSQRALENAGFIYFDRGLWYKEIDYKLAKELNTI
ncbi:hypothetical protein SAMN02745163_02951 [Clostridium cavendishii DSM 21758]|uniref:Uncharacterized protein n=1 Tax=Clostridium cavendishii DSM 21758 TaxID=1121302 RepID=A0A1M6NMN5_9CLOT|nr:hypothetical protein [Clostridium cavendishii]SHJ96822.1 hypothetical protein SAMN02745163_02951 [Clostridium cavendishii DSM 21758]